MNPTDGLSLNYELAKRMNDRKRKKGSKEGRQTLRVEREREGEGERERITYACMHT